MPNISFCNTHKQWTWTDPTGKVQTSSMFYSIAKKMVEYYGPT